MKIILIFSLIATIGIIPAYADSSQTFRNTPYAHGCYDFSVKDWSLAEFKRSKYDMDSIISKTLGTVDKDTEKMLDKIISKKIVELSSLKSEIGQQRITVDKYPENAAHKIKYDKMVEEYNESSWITIPKQKYNNDCQKKIDDYEDSVVEKELKYSQKSWQTQFSKLPKGVDGNNCVGYDKGQIINGIYVNGKCTPIEKKSNCVELSPGHKQCGDWNDEEWKLRAAKSVQSPIIQYEIPSVNPTPSVFPDIEPQTYQPQSGFNENWKQKSEPNYERSFVPQKQDSWFGWGISKNPTSNTWGTCGWFWC